MHIAKLLLILIIGSFALAGSGCDRDEGPAEEAGESLDEAGERLEETAEEACEDVKEGVDAEDTDC